MKNKKKIKTIYWIRAKVEESKSEMIPVVKWYAHHKKKLCIIIHWDRKCRAFYTLLMEKTTHTKSSHGMFERSPTQYREFANGSVQHCIELIRLQSLNIFTSTCGSEWCLTCAFQFRRMGFGRDQTRLFATM